MIHQPWFTTITPGSKFRTSPSEIDLMLAIKQASWPLPQDYWVVNFVVSTAWQDLIVVATLFLPLFSGIPRLLLLQIPCTAKDSGQGLISNLIHYLPQQLPPDSDDLYSHQTDLKAHPKEHYQLPIFTLKRLIISMVSNFTITGFNSHLKFHYSRK